MGNCAGDSKVSKESVRIRRKDGKCLAAKVVLLGNAGVGKSSICQKYINDTISEKYEVTIGGAYLQKDVQLANNQKLRLHIWDTGGEERYKAMAHLYYRDAQAALLVYDVGDTRSFHDMEYWIKELDERLREDDMIIYVAANKCDLTNKRISKDQGLTFATNHKLHFFEVSAKTGDGIGDIFKSLAESLAVKFPNNVA